MTTRNLLTGVAVVALLAWFWARGEQFLAANGPTFDEPVHLAAGYSYWTTGSFRLNREDPPFLKLLWAAPLLVGDRPPYPEEVAYATNNDHWHVGTAFLFHSGRPVRELLDPARRVNLALGCAVVLLAGWWAFRVWGSRLAGVGACAFAACDPNLLALSCVLTTDVGLTLFSLAACYLLWEYAAAPSRGLLVAAGIALGLALGAKFSALAVVVGLGAAGAVYVLRGGVLSLPSPLAGEGGSRSEPGEGALGDTNGAERSSGAKPTPHPAGEAPATLSRKGRGQEKPAWRERLSLAFPFAFRLGLIAIVTLAATYGFVHFDQWGRGLKFQLTRADHGDGMMYLNGEFSRAGWYHYFLVLLPLKLPLGLIAGVGLAALSLAMRRAAFLTSPPVGEVGDASPPGGVGAAPESVSPSPPTRRCAATSPSRGEVKAGARLAFLLAPPLVFFALASYSRVDLGVRVVLPVLPFLYVFAAGLACGACCKLAGRVVLGVCVAWAAASAVRSDPFPLAYFNEAAGGPRGAVRFVADSNVDWGQGLPSLKRYLDANGIDAVYLSYFGTDRPEAYGIRFRPLPTYGRVGDPGGEPIPADAPRHVVVVSANNLLGIYLNDPDTFAWLRGREPTAVLGSCLYVFDLTGDADAVRRVRSLPAR